MLIIPAPRIAYTTKYGPDPRKISNATSPKITGAIMEGMSHWGSARNMRTASRSEASVDRVRETDRSATYVPSSTRSR
jgi:hypothetical protein